MRIIYIIIAILLALDNVFIHFKVPLLGLSYDRFLEFILFFAFIKQYLAELRNNDFFKNWNAFIILFAFLQLLMNLYLALEGKLEFEFVYKYFIKCFSFLVYSFLFLLLIKKKLEYINIILGIHLLIILFAFLHHPLSPIAGKMMEFKQYLYSSSNVIGIEDKLMLEEVYISGNNFADRFRLSGPFNSSISFSYFAISSFIIGFYMYIKRKRRFYLVYLVLVFIASFLTQTRSLLLAEIFLVLGYMFFIPSLKRRLNQIILLSAALFTIVILFSSKDILTFGNSRLVQTKGENRPLLWMTGVYTVMNYPFGVSDQDYLRIKKEMYTKYKNTGVLNLSAHNGIVNIGFHYSIAGYFLLTFFVIFLLKKIKLLKPKFKIFFRLVLLSYLIHSSFHNDFVLSSDYPFLMVLMLISFDGINQISGGRQEPKGDKKLQSLTY